MVFKDHFSGHAAVYSQFRPHYPSELFLFLADLCTAHELALDVATGNGQAALGLVDHFSRVVACDASVEQVANAPSIERVEFVVTPAEALQCQDSSVDLVTVAQALHWFDLPRFYSEVRRVLKPRGVIAAWCYVGCSVNDAIDQVLQHYYHDVVGSYWPPERLLVEAGYQTLPFPFEELPSPEIAIRADLNLEQLVGYVATWSATQRYQQANNQDPTVALKQRLLHLWGQPDSTKVVTWPVALRVGRITS